MSYSIVGGDHQWRIFYDYTLFGYMLLVLHATAKQTLCVEQIPLTRQLMTCSVTPHNDCVLATDVMVLSSSTTEQLQFWSMDMSIERDPRLAIMQQIFIHGHERYCSKKVFSIHCDSYQITQFFAYGILGDSSFKKLIKTRKSEEKKMVSRCALVGKQLY